MRALILGATGLVGSRVLDLMLRDPEVDTVNILGRRSCGVEHQKIVEYITPLEKMEKYPEAFSVDVIFCCLGTTIKKAGSKDAFYKIDFELPMKAGVEAKRFGVDRFVLVSALGASSSSSIFYNKVKGELEDSLSKLEIENLFTVRPSLIVGKRDEERPAEALAMIGFKLLDPLFFGPLKKYAGSKVVEIAKLMVSLSKDTTFETAIEHSRL